MDVAALWRKSTGTESTGVLVKMRKKTQTSTSSTGNKNDKKKPNPVLPVLSERKINGLF